MYNIILFWSCDGHGQFGRDNNREAAREPWKGKKNAYYNTIITNPSRVNKDWARERRGARHYPIYITRVIHYILCLHVRRRRCVHDVYIMRRISPGPTPFILYNFFFLPVARSARGRYIIILLLSYVISWCLFFFILFRRRRRRRPAIAVLRQRENWRLQQTTLPRFRCAAGATIK